MPFPARFVRSENALPLGLLAPTIIFLTLLILIPVAQAILLSFQAVPGTLGFEAYRRMVTDVAFADSLRNTLLLLILVVPVQLVLALAMALLIHSRFPGHGVFLYIFALPLAISDLAAGIVWLAIFADTGYLNSALNGLGLTTDPINFLSYENLHLLLGTVIVAESWRATAIVLVILLAGLQLIPREYFEAADLFGASRLKRTLLIVLPMLRPSLQSALIIRTIFAFQTFAVVLALAGRQLPVLWLSFDNFAGILSAIVIAESWRATALVLVILIAGLQLIPRDFFEAADLFGAARLKRTLLIVLPMLRPSLQSALIIRTIFAFQTFAVVLALAGRQLPVLSYEAYDWYYNNRNEFIAAAFAALILVMTMTVVFFYLRLLRVKDAELQR